MRGLRGETRSRGRGRKQLLYLRGATFRERERERDPAAHLMGADDGLINQMDGIKKKWFAGEGGGGGGGGYSMPTCWSNVV